MIVLRSEREIKRLREAGRIVAQCLEVLQMRVEPGVSTRDLDAFAERFIRNKGGIPAFKGYRGYPATICASINDEVVHGIPNSRRLVEGDIISIDVGVVFEGYVGDAAITLPVGDISPKAKDLMRVTRESLLAGIEKVREGNRLTDISHAIQQHVETNGFSVVREYVGHGVGQKIHEEPEIPNFGPPGKGPLLMPGMVFAIEPMVNAGGYEVYTADDGWTVRTKDGSLSAHFEHTVAVTANGPEILTLP